MSTLMQASRQWASRPSDQRFISLHELHDFCQKQRELSTARVISSRSLQFEPTEQTAGADLLVSGVNGSYATLNHWSFGQAAARAGAPAGYLRNLPAPLIADCLNYGLKFNRDVEDIGVLVGNQGDEHSLRAVTGPGYGRVWNSTITRALTTRFGDGVTGAFKVPGEFGKDVPITRANTTLYASDRDMFVFLADEKNRIEVANRRDGQSGSLARGFFVWNSEVGSTTFGIALFLFDFVCMNRIVWGAQDYAEIRIRHTASAPDRFIEEVAPAIEAYAQSSTTNVRQAIEAAQAKRVDDVDDFLKNRRFTSTQVSGIKAAHMADEQRPIETLWDAATGVTAYARGIGWQNERVNLEREAGKILKLAA